MSGQHRATPEQWGGIERAAEPIELHPGVFVGTNHTTFAATIRELRNRVEALETGATCPHIVSSDEGTSYCRLAEQGIAPVSAMDELRAPTPEARPADGGLVERVAKALRDTPYQIGNWKPEAREAIREVAAALLEWHDSDQLVHTAWEAAKWLEQEANR